MSTRKLTEDERKFRLAQAQRRSDFIAGLEPARRLSKREREEAQRQFELEQKGDYRHMDEINEAEKESDKEYKAAAPFIPVEVFMMKKTLEQMRLVNETGQDPVRGQALVDLVASDVPLDPSTRRWIANELARLYKSERPVSPKVKRQIKLLAARQLQLYFENYEGMAPGDAEQAAAKAIGLDVDALRQRRRRARKRKQDLPRAAEFFGRF